MQLTCAESNYSRVTQRWAISWPIVYLVVCGRNSPHLTQKGYVMDITVTPAYGRDYNSGPAVLLAWQEGMDFQIVGLHPDSGRYINNRDAKRHAGDAEVWVRYSNLTKTIKVHG